MKKTNSRTVEMQTKVSESDRMFTLTLWFVAGAIGFVIAFIAVLVSSSNSSFVIDIVASSALILCGLVAFHSGKELLKALEKANNPKNYGKARNGRPRNTPLNSAGMVNRSRNTPIGH